MYPVVFVVFHFLYYTRNDGRWWKCFNVCESFGTKFYVEIFGLFLSWGQYTFGVSITWISKYWIFTHTYFIETLMYICSRCVRCREED